MSCRGRWRKWGKDRGEYIPPKVGKGGRAAVSPLTFQTVFGREGYRLVRCLAARSCFFSVSRETPSLLATLVLPSCSTSATRDDR